MGCLERESGYPLINDIEIYSITIDEWYGVEVRFVWDTQYDVTNTDDQKLAEHVARLVIDSPEYKNFCKSEHTAACEEYEDGPEREIVIPQFRVTDFDSWEFYIDGGWISATTR